MTETTFPMLAKTFRGLEDVLRDELIDLGAANVEIGNRMVSFEGDLEMLYRANFCCRTALRILKPIAKFTAADPDELYDIVSEMEWDKYLTPDSTFAVDTTVNSDNFKHSRYVAYRVKDGIVDYFSRTCGRRPSVRVTGYDVLLNVHISDDRVTISLDSSGAPLNQRGYRIDSTLAPLNEVLAAGIILKTGWRGDTNFVDPMCGSGTFLIESALIARNIYPGVFRKEFAFEKWPDFDRDLLAKIFDDDSKERDFKYRIYGGDIDPEAVRITRRNIREAHMDDVIEVSCRAFQDWTEAPQPGILITNPPYGERLKSGRTDELYSAIGTELKRHFSGYHAWILGYREEHFTAIGLKPSVKFPILNGALECSLREYVLFDGKYTDFKSDGGSVNNTGFNREAKPKTRRLTDREWDAETKKFGAPDRKKNRPAAKGAKAARGDRPGKPSGAPKKGGRPAKDNKPKWGSKPKTKTADTSTAPKSRGPRLGDEYTVILEPTPKMRPRKAWKKPEQE